MGSSFPTSDPKTVVFSSGFDPCLQICGAVPAVDLSEAGVGGLSSTALDSGLLSETPPGDALSLLPKCPWGIRVQRSLQLTSATPAISALRTSPQGMDQGAGYFPPEHPNTDGEDVASWNLAPKGLLHVPPPRTLSTRKVNWLHLPDGQCYSP